MIVDTALREREATGHPIRVGMIGVGATGRAIALQLGTPVPGIRLVAIAWISEQNGMGLDRNDDELASSSEAKAA